jgi:hypothetical protein
MPKYDPYIITENHEEKTIDFLDKETGKMESFNPTTVGFEIIRSRFYQEIKTPSDYSPFWFPTLWRSGKIYKNEISTERYKEIWKEAESAACQEMQKKHEDTGDEDALNWLEMFSEGNVKCKKLITNRAWQISIFEYAKIKHNEN